MRLNRTTKTTLWVITAGIFAAAGTVVVFAFCLDVGSLGKPSPLQIGAILEAELPSPRSVPAKAVKKVSSLDLNRPLYDKKPPPPPPPKPIDLEAQGTILEGEKSRAILRSRGRTGIYAVGERLQIDGSDVEIIEVTAATVTVKYDGQTKTLDVKGRSGNR